MTGQELLAALKAMDISELKYTVLIGSEAHGWSKLETITKDFEMKSLDLKGS